MKKILFATTALVATAGAASAEIALTGLAEMGILGGSRYGDTTQFMTDIDVTFTMSGEADNGLTFGANIDLDESDGSGSAGGSGTCFISDNDDIDAAMTINGETVDFGNVVGGVTEGGAFSDGDNDNAECFVTAYGAATGNSNAFVNTLQGGEVIWVAYGNAKLSMGDVDGAFDAAMQEVNIGGSIDDSETWHTGFSGNSGLDGTYDGQIAQFAYTFNSFTAYLSAEIDDSGTFDPVWGIGFRYTAELAGLDLGVGLGYQTVDYGSGFDESIWGISLDTTFNNGIQARVNYSDFQSDIVADWTHSAIGLGYTMNALTIGFNYGKYDFQGGAESKGYGLAVDYDLGGGLEVQFGYGYSEVKVGGASADADSFSLGLAMSF
ncbi:porin [Tropicibacter sp. S64]|uniref:porin n=1 Tax=Tropicibacter sp. S64 TaxID=3415122 RepID=UPI003C7A965B